MRVHPRHRGDCAEFFQAPQHTVRIQLDGPVAVISAIEQAAARTGRTWSDQFTYVLGICLGKHLPYFNDERGVEDWRMLLSPCRFRFSEAEAWSSWMCLWRTTPQIPVES